MIVASALRGRYDVAVVGAGQRGLPLQRCARALASPASCSMTSQIRVGRFIAV